MLVDGTTELTYSGLEVRANALARGLHRRGYVRGDVVALQPENSWQLVVSFFAVAQIGLVAMPLNLMVSAWNVAYQNTDSGIRAVITSASALPELSASVAESRSGDLVGIIVAGNCPVHPCTSSWRIVGTNQIERGCGNLNHIAGPQHPPRL